MGLISKIARNLRAIKCLVLPTLFPSRYITYRACIHFQSGEVVDNNWGDDVNPLIIEWLSGRKALCLPNCVVSRAFHIRFFQVIGSTLSFWSLKDAYVWGSGILNDQMTERIKAEDAPRRIYSVRGPLTRDLLMARGIDCPEVYGDPALLFPLMYTPSSRKSHKIGVIPHYKDLEKPELLHLLADEETTLIKVRGYGAWKNFIEEINSCDFVVSSSLHGVIIAEAYGVPCIWAKFGSYVDGWDFKYYDFFASIGKADSTYMKIFEDTTVSELKLASSRWRAGKIETDQLLRSCPFLDESRFPL